MGQAATSFPGQHVQQKRYSLDRKTYRKVTDKSVPECKATQPPTEQMFTAVRLSAKGQSLM